MHPVIFLWAHPRSMSTAIERIMRERGDLECLHEPFLHYYYLHRSSKPLPHFDSEQGHATDYGEIRGLILQRAEHSALFIKDMSYYVIPELLQDPDFCKRIRHCFLLRNPMSAIMSYYRLDNGVSQDEIGIESQWLHFQGLQALGIEDSIVLEAESVQADPAASMRRFWRALGLEYSDHALNWDDNSTPGDWQYVEGWHQSVSSSRGIRAQVPRDAQRVADDFAQLCREAPQLAQYLQHHLPFY
ncbi:MAG: hypothetical protein GY916_03060, partial [Gammaproteobacteria bacterium]|nr:hypothetical protein [Gammaproteobacteria bacterium]